MVHTLTGREREVVKLLAEGYSSKEIARQLAIGSRTVESHVDSVRLKTQTRNRTHLIAKLLEKGIL